MDLKNQTKRDYQAALKRAEQLPRAAGSTEPTRLMS
jgi:hypothetical protein